MDYGGCDKRRTKRDLKAKRRNRVYKRGGQFRTHEVEKEDKEVKNKTRKLVKGEKKKK